MYVQIMLDNIDCDTDGTVKNNDTCDEESDNFAQVDTKKMKKNLAKVFIRKNVTRNLGNNILQAIKSSGIAVPTDSRTILG